MCGFFIKMKKKIINNQIQLEPLPFFKKGSLVYAKSGHELEMSDRYYRCSKHCKTTSGEKQIKKENLEKNFTYFAQKFCIDPEKGVSIGNELLKKHLVELLVGTGFGDGKQEILDHTINVMDQSIKKIDSVKAEDDYIKMGKFKGGGKIKKEDAKDFENIFVAKHEEMRPIHLFAVLLSYMKTFSDERYAKHLGRGIALVTKKIYLSNTGKVEKIELERWGWYVMNYINRHIPDYLTNLKKSGVIITNGYDEILNMNIVEAIEYFKGSNFMEAMNWFDTGNLHTLFDIPQKVMKSMEGGPEDLNKMMLQFMEFINNNPIAQFSTYLLPAVGKQLKVKKQKNKK